VSSKPTWSGAPQAVYSGWAEHLEGDATTWRRWERSVSHTRLGVFAVGLVAGWLAFGSHQIPTSWVLPPAGLFLLLVILHDRAIRRLRVIERTASFFALGLARIDGSWPGKGHSGLGYLDPAHPYANDLDIFGEGSLFELLGTVRTSAGANLLARWLLEPAPAAITRQRQAAVRELVPRIELRRDLTLIGEDVGNRIGAERLIEWGNRPASLPAAGLHWLAGALTVTTLGSLAAWILTGAGAIPFLFAIAVQSAFALALRSQVVATLAAAEAPSQDLAVLSGLLARIEEEPVEADRLKELSDSLAGQAMPPSRRIAQLGRLMQFVDARRNQFFAPIGGLLLWGTQMALALERWRADCGPTLGPWVDASAEIEVLCALSGYAYEQPGHVFPEIVEDGPIFEAEGLGHPLISGDTCVPNDLTLSGDCRALVMSGSNMSGKSTLLRTAGCAAIMALAGAPVRANRLRLSPIQIGASIRISDSLRTGTSHFLAEIRRLRQIVDLTELEWPVLFLLDEVLHGTNSHDRKIGADAVLRGLLKRGAIGIVTTHDLALARIAEHRELAVNNVHFQDRIENGQMFFDFRLREGVVARSNALELMRSVGLDV
jgi:hypothetical protein